MLGAGSGSDDAEEWADLLIRALDKARALGALGQEETIHRRIVASVAAMQYFGVKGGDGARDPELVFSWLTEELGGSREALLDKCRMIASPAPETIIGKEYYSKIKWLQSVRTALQSLCEMAEYMEDGPARNEAKLWCEITPLIPSARSQTDGNQ
jgi:hypothetical protein